MSAVARFSIEGPTRLEYAACEAPTTVDHGTFTTRIIAPNTVYRPVLRRLRHLIDRPRLQPLAVSLFRQAYQAGLRAAIPDDANVIHSIGTGRELLGFAALAEARRRGAILSLWPAVHPGTWGDSPLDVEFYRQSDAVFAQSTYELNHLRGLGVDSSQLFLGSLAPATEALGDGSRFRAHHRLGKRPLVLFIGRKQKYKGYHELCLAMASVHEAVPESCLVAIGPWGEPPFPPLPEGALIDLGHVDEQEKADALAACDVFCMPSTGEAFGIVYVEAWAYGKPVVAGPAPAVRELVTDGVNGFCVPQRREEIAAVLIRLLRDPELRRELGERGRAVQQTRFTWDAVTTTHRQVFQELLLAKR